MFNNSGHTFNNALYTFISKINRLFSKRADNILVDEVGGRNATPLYPVSLFNGIDGKLVFSDLTGVTITSYEGDQILSISGNNIIASAAGSVHSLLLSNGWYFPLPHLGYGFDQNGDKVDLTVSGGVTGDYDENGSSHLIDKGAVERSENRFTNTQMIDSNGDGLADGLSALGGKGEFSIVTGNGFSGNAQRIDYDSVTAGLQSLNIFDILETGEQFKISFYYRTNIDNLAITDAVNALDPDNPSPRLKVNTADAILYSTIVTYKGTNNDIYFSSWLQNEGDWFEIGDIHISKVKILPNNNEGQPISPIQEGDVFIAGSSFINETDFMIDMSRPNGAEAENVVNGGFVSSDNWLVAGETTIGDGYARIYSSAGAYSTIYQQNVLEVGQDYIFSYEVINTNGEPLSLTSFDIITAPKIGNNTFVGTAINSILQLKRITINETLCELTNISVKLATPEVLFFNKSDASIWKDAVTSSIYYNSNNPFEWHSSELTQESIEDNLQPDYINMFNIKIKDSLYKKFFLLNTSISGVNIEKLKYYLAK